MIAARHAQGSVLTMALVSALVASIGVTTMLFLAVANARQARSIRERMRARYLAEAALVRAQGRLWLGPADAANCPSSPMQFDLDNNGIPDESVDVTAMGCPGFGFELVARRTY
jgi:Tfp pilus assembly protein PilX